jgi:hypothetical protein
MQNEFMIESLNEKQKARNFLSLVKNINSKICSVHQINSKTLKIILLTLELKKNISIQSHTVVIMTL